MGNARSNKHSSVFSIQLLECALVVLFIVLSLTLSGGLTYHNPFPFGIVDGVLMYAVIAAAGVMLLGVNKYFSFLPGNFAETAAKIFAIVVILNFVFIALLYFSRSIRLSPYYFVVADTFLFLFLLGIKGITGQMKGDILKERISLVIGKCEEQNPLLTALKKQGIGRTGFAADTHPKLPEYLEKADNIYLSGALSRKFKDQIISFCVLQNKRVFVVPSTYEIAVRKSEMTQVGDIPVFAIDSFRLTEAQNIFKRLCDICFGILGIALSSPIMLYAAVRIKIEDGGPVFYRQERAGLNGKKFHVLKFRSMVVDAEKHTGAVFAAENDPRVTRIGKRMRAARIDEIPQFFNVMSGTMSMVGPRPERPMFVEAFSRELPEYTSRLAVKPGITGLAQVMGNYTTSAENKVKFDLVYIRNYSFWLDFKILVKTIKVVFTREQAAGFAREYDSQAAGCFDPEMVLERAVKPGRSLASYYAQRIGKAAGVLLCCMVVILGSTFLRYSALAMTMMEAAIPSDTEQITVGQNLDTEQPLYAEQPLDAEQSPGAYGDSDSHGETEINVASIDGAVESGDGADLRQGSGIGETSDTSKGTSASPVNTINSDGVTSNAAAAATTGGASANKTARVILSSDKITSALNEMTMSEKMKIGVNFLARLSTADLMFLEKLAEGGFTAKEKEAAKELMYQKFDNTEVAYIKDVYWEYMR